LICYGVLNCSLQHLDFWGFHDRAVATIAAASSAFISNFLQYQESWYNCNHNCNLKLYIELIIPWFLLVSTGFIKGYQYSRYASRQNNSAFSPTKLVCQYIYKQLLTKGNKKFNFFELKKTVLLGNLFGTMRSFYWYLNLEDRISTKIPTQPSPKHKLEKVQSESSESLSNHHISQSEFSEEGN
jgi:hypothetical protein